MDQIFDRFERLFKSWVSGSADGGTQSPRYSGNSDFDAAMDELDDYLDAGRTETEARERDRARREREEAARRAATSSSARPHGPPAALVQAYRSLGLSYGVPFPEVKAAYKRLLMQNHPDRNSATPEQLKRSTEISVQLNAAYQRIETWNAKGTLDEN
ncbi:MAG: J domain-containing protein [Rectinemataceae bacterium]